MGRITLENQTILITGATSGLGRAMALALAPRGNRIIVTGRRAALLETLAREVEAHGSRCLTAAVDATDEVEVATHLADAIAHFGRIDVAILNAGGGTALQLGSERASAAAVKETMSRNYDTLVNYLIPLLDHMRDAGGTIAYTCSPAGTFGLPNSGPYSAAKAAGRVLFDTARIELGHTPIRFVAFYPGFTYTDGLIESVIPFKGLIIQKERAVREMLRAIERGTAHAMFPRRIAWP
ncbi:MAG: SDR family NAD(P)-dependent oxidoreductase, partial [Myxococcales bacterium]|nr:SDR family NAD(P)-dependent oxidoreductase [Myxococcales bacterium]